MRKEDLSIGDYVMVESLKYFCDEEDFSNGICMIKNLTPYEVDVYGYEELDYTDLKPVELNETILVEVFGFVKEDNYLIKDLDSRHPFKKFLWGTDTKVLRVHTDLMMAEFNEIKYVHQLQRIIKMSGANGSFLNLDKIETLNI
jgi:hypothetical protein